MILYICPDCGSWMISIGLLEALANGSHAEFVQRCKVCNAAMQMVSTEDKIALLPHLIEAGKGSEND